MIGIKEVHGFLPAFYGDTATAYSLALNRLRQSSHKFHLCRSDSCKFQFPLISSSSGGILKNENERQQTQLAFGLHLSKSNNDDNIPNQGGSNINNRGSKKNVLHSTSRYIPDMEDQESQEIIQVMERYYRALSRGDYETIIQLYIPDSYVSTHIQGMEEGYGIDGVYASYKDHMEKYYTKGEIYPIITTDVKVYINGITAWLICKEVAKIEDDNNENNSLEDINEKKNMKMVTSILDSVVDMPMGKNFNEKEIPPEHRSTMIFRKFNGAWKIVHHQSADLNGPQSQVKLTALTQEAPVQQQQVINPLNNIRNIPVTEPENSKQTGMILPSTTALPTQSSVAAGNISSNSLPEGNNKTGPLFTTPDGRKFQIMGGSASNPGKALTNGEVLNELLKKLDGKVNINVKKSDGTITKLNKFSKESPSTSSGNFDINSSSKADEKNIEDGEHQDQDDGKNLSDTRKDNSKYLSKYNIKIDTKKYNRDPDSLGAKKKREMDSSSSLDTDNEMTVRIQTAKAFEENPSSGPLMVSTLSSTEGINNEPNEDDGVAKMQYFDEGLLVRRTMKAVRRLNKEGRISLTMKRKLLFSILQAAANDNIAQVVNAYEMLVEDQILSRREKSKKGAIQPPCYDEFIDQCHIICKSIPLTTTEDAFDEKGNERPEDFIADSAIKNRSTGKDSSMSFVNKLSEEKGGEEQ